MSELFPPLTASAPLLHWRWDNLTSIAEQLRTIAAAQYGGVVLPAPAMLGDGELQQLRRCCAAAQKLSLRVWIRTTLESGPAASCVQFQVQDVAQRDAARWHVPAGGVLSAVAAPLDARREQPDFVRAADLRRPGALSALRSDARVWIATRREYSAADSLHPQTAQSWIVNIGERLGAELAEYSAAGTFVGFLLRAPSLWPGHEDEVCFPWSPLLPEAFERRHGGELALLLPALVASTGDEATRVRQNFWAAIADLQRAVWRELDEWARTRALQMACVLPREADSLQATVRYAGDVAAWWDAVPNLVVETATETHPLALLAASRAALRGDGAVLAEVCDAPGGSTPATRLQTAHGLLRRGLTRFAFGVRCEREYSLPEELAPGETQQPYFEKSAAFARYLARCGRALEQGRTGARIGVLWPARSALAQYHPHGHRFARRVGEDFDFVLQLLDELQFDYLLLPEATLCEARCEGERLLCGAARLPLEMVIVAGATTLSRAAWNKIEEFVASGGKAACLGILPRWSEIGRDREQEERINKTTLTTLADGYEAGENGATESYPIFHEHRSGGRLCCYQPRLNPDRDDARRRVRQILRESLAPDLETPVAELRYARRVQEGNELFFVVNTAAHAQRARLRLHAGRENWQPFRFNAETGEFRPLPVWMPIEGPAHASITGGLALEIELAPEEAALLQLRPGDFPHAERANFAVETVEPPMVRGHARESGVPAAALRAGGRLRWHYGTPVEVPVPLLLSGDWSARRLAPNAWRGTRFRREEGVSRLFLAVPRWLSAAPILNGNAAPAIAAPFAVPPWNAPQWRWFDLNAAHNGENEIRGAAEAFVVGDFEIDDEFGLAEVVSLVAPQPLLIGEGSWHEQGLPFYVGTLEYSTTTGAPANWDDCRIVLELARARDVVEAFVNGVSCGVRVAAPYRWNVTPHFVPGAECELRLLVSNTTAALEGAALEGAEPPAAGLPGPARLAVYPLVEIDVTD